MLALCAACGEPTPPVDDAGTLPCVLQGIDWSHASVGVTPGTTRDVYLELRRDWGCGELPVTLTVSGGGGTVEALPIDLAFEPGGTTRIPIEITGATEGSLTITAVAAVATLRAEAVLEVDVTGASLPACDGAATGRVVAGGELRVPDGAIARSHVALPEGAARDDRYHADDFDAAIACAPDQLPAGYVALGPAVSFTSAQAYRFQREIDFAVPIRLSLLPSHAHRGHVEVAYTGPGVATARVVPIANPVFEGDAGGGLLRFQAPRLGTYQAVVRGDAPQRVMRRFNYRGILGISMGGSGSGRVGIGNPEDFDFVAPLGGPTDWQYMLEYIRRYHLGGFCTEAQRAAGEEDCSGTTQERTPARGELYEHVQHYEHWWYEDEYDGQGGTFDRAEYVEIFRDLSAMYGNANTDGSATEDGPSVTPPGVPDSDRFVAASERCAPAGIRRVEPEPAGGDADPATGFFDDEYNPEGQYPVITFCDGGQVPGDIGRWSPDGARVPIEVAYAVDVNGNGLRDGGEPVVRNGREPFADVGADGLPSAMEPGYDPLTNPDPSGDDYDFQYNPAGTEGSWDWEEGEAYDDVGLDGVAGTAQLADGGYDRGEGDGVFTRARGASRMMESSPRQMVRALDDATLASLDVFADGGVRDLFNWVVMGHHSMGGLAARGLPVRFYNGHAALHLDGRDTFTFGPAPIDEIGRYAMVRYGSIDATEDEKRAGDGGHVGTIDQLQNRLFGALAMMDRRWPGGDRRIVRDELCGRISPACDHVNSIALDFTSPTTGRTGPVTIVLPPGYFDDEYATTRYPVVYFLHGYGMEPADLLATGLLLWNYMTAPTLPESQRFQKAIFVFPDGRCRNQECVNGTFFTDAPASTPNGAQMETFLLDVVEHIDATYRTRAPEVVEVVQ
jgi:hypothetical protein